MKSYLGLALISFALLAAGSCSEDSTDDLGNQGGIDPNAIIYDGPSLTFTKASFADFSLPANQDRITSNVWLTRGNEMGLYNAQSESVANKNTSPAGTEWAEGTLEQIESLSFTTFDLATGGQNQTRNIPGKTFVVHLIADNIYLELTFLSWAQGNQGGGGGFSYERTTP